MSASWRVLRNHSTDEVILARARWCSSYWCHLRGLQFVRHLPENEGLLFVTGYEGRTHTAIHMFFMFFSIAVVWLDKAGVVVDKQLARPWRPAYAPRSPAQYYIEARPSLLDRVEIGDPIRFDEESS
jgi:uncharacterized membrane protein (UPF0127 family)